MSEVKIRPLYDRIVVQQIEAKTETEGGILLTGDTQEKPHEGIVLAAGPGHRDHKGEFVPMDVDVGDKVLFGQYVGQEATIDGETYLILTQDEIIAILV